MRPRRVLTVGAATLVCAGCAAQQPTQSQTSQAPAPTPTTSKQSSGPTLHGHPQAVEPVAGAVPATSQGVPESAGVSVGPPSRSLPEPISESQVREQLTASGMTASPNQASLTRQGLAVAPIDAPAVVQEVIAAGNQIAKLPYRYGGGHVTYQDTAYDCSGSISYVFAAAHLLNHTVVSGDLENWGDPGPGKWITVFANAGHTFMYVAGLRFDTVALAETGSRWSDRSANEPDLKPFAVRHPPGL